MLDAWISFWLSNGPRLSLLQGDKGQRIWLVREKSVHLYIIVPLKVIKRTNVKWHFWEGAVCVCVGAGAAVVQWSQVSVPCTRHYTTYNSVTVSQLTHETHTCSTLHYTVFAVWAVLTCWGCTAWACSSCSPPPAAARASRAAPRGRAPRPGSPGNVKIKAVTRV